MGTDINEDVVRHIAHLSRLTMSDDEVAAMAGELAKIVAYIDLMSELDTTDVDPTAHALPVQNVFRADEVGPSYDADRSLANAPRREGPFFRVPKMLDNTGA